MFHAWMSRPLAISSTSTPLPDPSKQCSPCARVRAHARMHAFVQRAGGGLESEDVVLVPVCGRDMFELAAAAVLEVSPVPMNDAALTSTQLVCAELQIQRLTQRR